MGIRRPLTLVAGVPAELPAPDQLGGDVAYIDTFGLGVTTAQAALDIALAASSILLSSSGSVVTSASGAILIRS